MVDIVDMIEFYFSNIVIDVSVWIVYCLISSRSCIWILFECWVVQILTHPKFFIQLIIRQFNLLYFNITNDWCSWKKQADGPVSLTCLQLQVTVVIRYKLQDCWYLVNEVVKSAP